MTLRQLIEQKIHDANLGFKEVAGAADLANIMNNRVSVPGCYLFRQRNNVSENGLVNAVSQQVRSTISIVVATRNVRDSRGADSSDENESFCQEIQTLLLNWPPSPEYDPLEYAGGALVTFKDGLFVWQDSYRTQHLIRG